MWHSLLLWVRDIPITQHHLLTWIELCFIGGFRLEFLSRVSLSTLLISLFLCIILNGIDEWPQQPIVLPFQSWVNILPELLEVSPGIARIEIEESKMYRTTMKIYSLHMFFIKVHLNIFNYILVDFNLLNNDVQPVC